MLASMHFKGKARILHTLCPKSGIRHAKIFGFDAELDLSNYIERSMFLGVFEPQETRLVQRYLKPGMIVVDAGANVGYYTLLASSLVGSTGHVYAFEPSPYAVNKLRATVMRNGIENVTVIQSALGNAEGHAELYIPANDNGNHTPSMVKQDFAPTEIAITTLDVFLEQEGIDRVDLLKMDVEGFEPNIVRGADQSLRSGKIKAILCEFCEAWLTANGSSPKKLFALFESFGLAPHGCVYRSALPLQTLLLTSG